MNSSSSFLSSIDRERRGVPAVEFARNIQKLGLTKTRAAQIFRIPRSTLTYKISSNALLFQTNALAAIRLEKLCGLVDALARNSLHRDAKGFDAGKWLGGWLEMPHPALAGLKPADLLDTETGSAKVFQILGAFESGVYL